MQHLIKLHNSSIWERADDTIPVGSKNSCTNSPKENPSSITKQKDEETATCWIREGNCQHYTQYKGAVSLYFSFTPSSISSPLATVRVRLTYGLTAADSSHVLTGIYHPWQALILLSLPSLIHMVSIHWT